ncbi:MAG: HAD family hydrolase [Selenomonadaceae bacterium]|nr:HAD family hydrolase [Selenomonadaceae bacterium]
MIKGIIFDLDNTLYDYNAGNKIAREKLAQRGSEMFRVSPEEFLRVYDEANQAVKARMGASASCHNRMLYAQGTVEKLGGELVTLAPELYEIYWGTILDIMELYPGALDFIKQAKEKGCRIGICTDMTAHIQYRKLAKLGLSPYVDAIVTSEEMGVEKPHAAMFHGSLDKLKTKSHETLYIGDSYERDIQGAAGVGITPVWFVADRPYEPRENVCTIKSFADKELYRLLES